MNIHVIALSFIAKQKIYIFFIYIYFYLHITSDIVYNTKSQEIKEIIVR